MALLLLAVLFVLLAAAVPAWPYGRDWNLGPRGAIGAGILMVVILFLLERV